MSNRIFIASVPVDVLDMEQTLNIIHQSIAEKRSIHHVVVNAAKIVYARKNLALMESIVNCDIINADGQAVKWASQFLNKPLPMRVAGIDLMQNLVASASERKHKIFFLGAREEIVKKVVDIYKSSYGDKIIAGYRNGYFKEDDEMAIAKQIAQSKADILFVAMSSPKKEFFLNNYKNVINVPFIMGVGGSFDVIAGKVKRAPKWMQESGLEWFYRVLQEPKRMAWRYLYTNTIFIYLVGKEKIQEIFKKSII